MWWSCHRAVPPYFLLCRSCSHSHEMERVMLSTYVLNEWKNITNLLQFILESCGRMAFCTLSSMCTWHLYSKYQNHWDTSIFLICELCLTTFAMSFMDTLNALPTIKILRRMKGTLKSYRLLPTTGVDWEPTSFAQHDTPSAKPWS